MPYRWRIDTLSAVVIGGMSPKESRRGKQRHSPASRAVLQAKQGKHQKAKQPETKTGVHLWCFPAAKVQTEQSELLKCLAVSALSSMVSHMLPEYITTTANLMSAGIPYQLMGHVFSLTHERSPGIGSIYLLVWNMQTWPDFLTLNTHSGASPWSNHRCQSSICWTLWSWQRAWAGTWPSCQTWLQLLIGKNINKWMNEQKNK